MKIMQKMGYNERGLGKHGKGIQEPILPIMRPKYEGLGYMIGRGKNDIGVRGSSKSAKIMQSIHYLPCNRKGHTKEKCWDLHPSTLCGLRNHCEKMCWNRE